MKYTLGKRSQKNYDTLHPDLQKIIDVYLSNGPVDITLTEGFRTAERQFELFKIGRTYVDYNYKENDPRGWVESYPDKRGVVTYCDGTYKLSKHQTRKALDICIFVKGRPDLAYDKIHLSIAIGSLITIANILYQEGEIQHVLRSGADWDRDGQYLEPGTFIDMPHVELITP
jgi:hypothetical protein